MSEYETIERSIERIDEEADQDSNSELNALLAVATTAYDDFSSDYAHVIITIGKGMFWSKEFDMEARALCAKIEKEFECITSMSK